VHWGIPPCGRLGTGHMLHDKLRHPNQGQNKGSIVACLRSMNREEVARTDLCKSPSHGSCWMLSDVHPRLIKELKTAATQHFHTERGQQCVDENVPDMAQV
jgi:hypothetical protein